MSDFLDNFASSIFKNLRLQGWDRTRITYGVSVSGFGKTLDYFCVEPRAEQPGEDLKLSPIYISVPDEPTPEWEAAEISRILDKAGTPKSLKTKQILEIIAKATELSSELGLPPDFINPLTAMAEQLRTNIIEHKTSSDWELPDLEEAVEITGDGLN